MAWIMQGNRPVNTDSIAPPNNLFVGDSPYTFWRIDPNANEGRPYQGLMIGIPFLHSGGGITAYWGDKRVPIFYWGEIPIYDAYYGDTKIEN